MTAQTGYSQKLDQEIASLLRRMHVGKNPPTKIGRITFSGFLSNKPLMILVIRNGVPYSLFSLIQNVSPFSEENWAEILDISTKSLQRYKVTARSFKPIHSEKIIEMAEVTQMGLDTFRTMDKFKLWLETPNFALGNVKPFDLLKDSYGKELVLAELSHVNHGIFV